jgi:hypothetical protein
MSARDQVRARMVSGPIGRGVAFAADLAAVLLRHVRERGPRSGR